VDAERLLRLLNAHKVRYVVIGATAFPVHGYARATLDIDIFIDATPDNARATNAHELCESRRSHSNEAGCGPSEGPGGFFLICKSEDPSRGSEHFRSTSGARL
jgi:hypothetical protein